MYIEFIFNKKMFVLLKTKDEFLGMFFIELSSNIPNESPEQPMLTRDYPLLKRRL